MTDALISSIMTAHAVKLGMAILLFTIVAMLLFALLRRNKLISSSIDLDALLLDDTGKMSKSAAVMFGAFALTSWVIIFLTLSDKITEGYLGMYMVNWVAPAVVSIFKPKVPRGDGRDSPDNSSNP